MKTTSSLSRLLDIITAVLRDEGKCAWIDSVAMKNTRPAAAGGGDLWCQIHASPLTRDTQFHVRVPRSARCRP